MEKSYRLLVGVDGSAGGRLALRWAMIEAARRGGTVQAVTAWRWDGPDTGETSPGDAQSRAMHMLDGEVAAVRRETHSQVPVATETVQGDPATVLTRAASDSDMLVLGSHGYGRLRHAVLGSVSEACIRAARCPVVVLPVPKPAPVPAEPAVRS